jgi:hypothetical protein
VDVVESKQTGGASSQEIQVRSQERIYDLHHGRFSEPNAKRIKSHIGVCWTVSSLKLSWRNPDVAATRPESLSKGDTRQLKKKFCLSRPSGFYIHERLSIRERPRQELCITLTDYFLRVVLLRTLQKEIIFNFIFFLERGRCLRVSPLMRAA